MYLNFKSIVVALTLGVLSSSSPVDAKKTKRKVRDVEITYCLTAFWED